VIASFPARGVKRRLAPQVAALEVVGWSVWWDMALAPGAEFNDQPCAVMQSAHRGLVTWTLTCVSPRWVHGEARGGKLRSVLAPVGLEGATPRVDVRAIEPVDHRRWGDVTQGACHAVQQSRTARFGAPSKARASCVASERELDHLHGQVARAVGADHRDAARTMAWGQLDTTVRMVAATKAMTILALLLSIDRGHIDVDARVTGENSPMPAKMS
jgi:hypothetical protein